MKILIFLTVAVAFASAQIIGSSAAPQLPEPQQQQQQQGGEDQAARDKRALYIQTYPSLYTDPLYRGLIPSTYDSYYPYTYPYTYYQPHTPYVYYKK